MTACAFIDESGNDGHSPVMVLAALVATYERWKSFSDEWQAELATPPRVKCFKSYDAAKLTGYFARLTRQQAEAKTERLASVAVRHIEYGIVELVYNDEFDEVMKGGLYRPNRRLAKDMKDPYFLLFHGLVKNIIREQLSRKIKVDFTFDEYNKIGRKCLRRINEGHFTRLLPDGHKEIIGRAIPGNDDEFLPLQAADLVAGQYRRSIAGIYLKEPVHSNAVTKLRESDKIQMGLVHKEEMQTLAAHINVMWSVVVLSRIREEQERRSKG